jgi:UDP-N-acetylglucosamine 2-epimerase (non-hydrolysing)
MKILVVFGTRPEAIKMAPVVKALAASETIHPVLCVTGQHRDMLAEILNFFELVPDHDLALMRPEQDLAAPAWIASGFYSRRDAFSKAAFIAAASEHDAAIAPALAVIDAEIGDLEYRGRVSRTPHPHAIRSHVFRWGRHLSGNH